MFKNVLSGSSIFDDDEEEDDEEEVEEEEVEEEEVEEVDLRAVVSLAVPVAEATSPEGCDAAECNASAANLVLSFCSFFFFFNKSFLTFTFASRQVLFLEQFFGLLSTAHK